jgi:hypothetical protein
MPKFKVIYAEECTCKPGEPYADGSFPIFTDNEDSAIKKQIWFIQNYAHYKKYDKWLYEEHFYWGIHIKGKHVLGLRLM